MLLQELELEKYRNFSRFETQFSQKTAVIGRNGAGKSNLLESIRLLSVGKSFKTSRFDEIIQFSQPYLQVRGKLTDSPIKLLEFFYGQQFPDSLDKDRQLRVDNKPIGWLDFFGQFPSVLFLPTDVEIITGSPQVRRRYIDSIFWQVDKEYRQASLELSRVLAERSALLFLLKVNRAAPDEIRPWNQLLQNLTTAIQTKRQLFADYLNQELATQAESLKPKLEVKVKYQPNLADLGEVMSQEIKLAQNLFGPHRDELEIEFNGRSARRFASRGQTRVLVILLKLAEINYLKAHNQVEPIILLDDMISELDQPNSRQMFELFTETGQVIATSIELTDFVKDWQIVKLDQ